MAGTNALDVESPAGSSPDEADGPAAPQSCTFSTWSISGLAWVKRCAQTPNGHVAHHRSTRLPVNLSRPGASTICTRIGPQSGSRHIWMLSAPAAALSRALSWVALVRSVLPRLFPPLALRGPSPIAQGGAQGLRRRSSKVVAQARAKGPIGVGGGERTNESLSLK